MKQITFLPPALIAVALLLLASPAAEARSTYGVAGPRGAAVVGNDRAVAVTRRGVAVAGPNGVAVARRGVAVAPRAVVVTPGPIVVAPRPIVVAPRPIVVAPLPVGYIRVVPAGYRTVVYRGYTCQYVGGVYYRPVMYQGTTVYVTID
jgi:hypothetical protein